jgi:Family of unknown function (DUF6069)
VTNAPGFGDGRQLPRVYVNPAADQHGGRRTVEVGRLWVGGLMVAVVAAGLAVVGLILARGIADVPVLAKKNGQLVNAETWWYAAAAFAGALVATGLLNVLLLWSPRPYLFFGWIIGLATAAAALVPFTFHAELASKVATCAINLAIGVCTGSILAGIGRSAAQVRDEPGPYGDTA